MLFLGAGFSLAAKNGRGQLLPGRVELTEELWKVAFPGREFDPGVSLGDAFHAARRRNPAALQSLIRSRLTVEADSLPDWYQRWLKVPWASCFTLNIDDLMVAATRRFDLGRQVHVVSAPSGKDYTPAAPSALDIVHLNGFVLDDAADLVFSDVDYGRRLVTPDRWLDECTGSILSRPVVFVGTTIAESPLWQYMSLRQERGGRGTREFRPGSYLVSDRIDAAREVLLSDLNIDFVGMTAEQFANQVLADMDSEIAEGRRALASRLRATSEKAPPLVSELSARPPRANRRYLLGEEPDWADLTEGIAIERDCDKQLFDQAKAVLAGTTPTPPVIVTGTAGSGKTTSMMRLALRLSAEGVPSYWIDRNDNVNPFDVSRLPQQHASSPLAIFVDDADAWGASAIGWAREVWRARARVLLVLGVRGTRISGRFDEASLQGVRPIEVGMPPLADTDIEALLATLDRHNLLGRLKGVSHEERIAAFRKEAGRQLIVAMIQATSGRQFREKILDEFSELSGAEQRVYACVSLVSAQRFTLSLEEILTASGAPDNETLNAVEALVRRGVIIRSDKYEGYQARHRVVGEEVTEQIARRQAATIAMQGLAFAFANRMRPGSKRYTPEWRRMIRFISHDFILRIVGPDSGREIYRSIEGALSWDAQYWLQRGSLEVEEGDLDLAENFLEQARSLSPDQFQIETEYGYFLMKKASHRPTHPNAPRWFEDGRLIIEGMIARFGQRDSHPYHILGSQTLGWTRQGQLTKAETREALKRSLDAVEEGLSRHPHSTELQILLPDLKREWMQTAV